MSDEVFAIKVNANGPDHASEKALDEHILEAGLADENDADDMQLTRDLFKIKFVFEGHHDNQLIT